MLQDLYSENRELADKLSAAVTLLIKGKKISVPEGKLMLAVSEQGTPVLIVESNELQMLVDSCMWLLSTLSDVPDKEISKLIAEDVIETSKESITRLIDTAKSD